MVDSPRRQSGSSGPSAPEYKHENFMQHLENADVSEKERDGDYSKSGEEIVRPTREFSAEEEARIWRKVDMRLLPYLALLYLLSFMDRGNIGNARLAGLEKDLGMKGDDYSIALSCFFLTYCFFEVPSNLMLKKLRPSLWLGLITVIWGIVMTLMGVVKSFGGLVAARLALGIAEAGLFPGVILYLTIWYPRHMCQQRIALFFSAATLAGAFSGLLAYGIQFMSGTAGLNGWCWIFILEGLATVLAGVGAFFAIVDSPRHCNFLTKEEQDFIIWRKSSDSGSAGEATGVSTKYIKQALTDWQCWLALGYYLGVVVPLYSIGLFMPTLINAFGKYTRPQVQLLTVPVYVSACIYVIATAILSDKLKTRFPFVMVALVLALLGTIINITPAPSGVKFFGLFLMAMGAYGGLPSSIVFLSNNLAGQTKRGVGTAFQIGIGNLGALVSSNVYRSKDSPRYLVGHGSVIACITVGLICAPIYAFLLNRANKRKEAELEYQNSLPDNEKRVYTVQELHDLGDRHPSFRYTI